MQTVRQWLQEKFPKIFPKPAPVIMTEYGPVTEWARYQAAMNMKADAERRTRVENYFIEKHGGNIEKGMAECRHNYPEVYTD